MWYVLIFGLLTCCPNAETSRKPAKIEHITRKNITEQYKFESKPYLDEGREENLFDTSEFYAPSLEQQSQIQNKLSHQEEIEKLAKMKRAGRLSQKDYNAKVTSIHARKKKEAEQACTPVAPKPVEPSPIVNVDPKLPENPSHLESASAPQSETKPLSTLPKTEYKIETLKIHPNDEIWDEE